MKKIFEIGNIEKGIFKDRPNRFIADIEIDNKIEKCHVHDSGRIKELLFSNNIIGVKRATKLEKRKTAFDVISALTMEKDEEILINSAYHRYISENLLKDFTISPFGEVESIKAEVKYGESRLDYLLTKNGEKIWIEVKGVSLSENKIAKFPDAPSTRAQKHLKELMKIKSNGERAAILLLVFRDSHSFRPKFETDREFAQLFYEAIESGVEVYPIQFKLIDNSIYYIDKNIEIIPKENSNYSVISQLKKTQRIV